ncbi:MAG: ADP-ribosylation factor-like protein [Candidatus Hodarchaeota archaeon]
MFDAVDNGGKMKKIIFTGLDNSGKSSIIYALQEGVARIVTLRPTTFVERSSFRFLDYTIAQHDLGGQKKYRINYLKNPGKFFLGTDVCIYVVDIQDLGRYEDAISYFYDLLTEFENLEIKPFIYVFFHKAERLLIEENVEDRRGMDLLLGRFADINHERFELGFKITTIFDVWTITSSFSDIMLKLHPRGELIDKTVKELANNLNAEAVILFDKNILILAQYFPDKSLKILAQYIAPSLFKIESVLDRFEDVKKDKMKLEMEDYEVGFMDFKDSKPRIYLVAIARPGKLPRFNDLDRLTTALPDLFLSLGINFEKK